MQPKVIRSLFFMLFLNLVIKPVWLLGIDRTVQNLVGTSEYGVYYALFSLTFYLQIILDPGLHTFNNRSIAQDNARLSEQLSAFIPLKLILSLTYLGGTLLLGWLFGFHFHHLELLWWIALNQALASFILYLRSNLAGLFLFYSDSIFSVLDRLLMIIICAGLIWGSFLPKPFKIEWFVYAQTASSAATALVALWLTLRKSQFFRPKIQFSAAYKLLLQSYPFAILTVLMTLYSRIDSLMLERLLPDGAYQAGIYAAAYRLLDAASMIAFLFATILLPVFTDLITRKQRVDETIAVCIRMLYVPGLLLVLASFFYRHEIMEKLYTGSTEFTATVFGFLMIGFLALCNVYIFGTLLTANGNLRFLNSTAAIGVIANILLNVFLIFRYGALGTVIATLATQGLVSTIQVVKAHKLFHIKYSKKELLQFAAYLLFSLATFVFFKDLTGKWLLSLLTLTAINLTFAFMIGLIRPAYISTLLKFKLNDSVPAERE